jgi:hypothetical protein
MDQITGLLGNQHADKRHPACAPMAADESD